MAKSQHFEAVIQEADRGGAYIIVPFDVEQVYGKKRVKIKATFDGEPYRGSLVRMGSPDHLLIIRKAICTKIGKAPGDTVSVTLEEDTEPRVVIVPDDLKAAMASHPDIVAFFDKLSYTHQKEYVQWIEGAKKQETRARRIARALELMKAGQKGK